MSDLEAHRSPLGDLHATGGSVGAADGTPRHFGDPAREYAAALGSVAAVDRSDRFRFYVSGRAPTQMLDGILTGTVPPPAEPGAPSLSLGQASYSAVLTPKGRMVTDLNVFTIGSGEEVMLLDVPGAGGTPLREHFRRFLPPRLARVDDRSDRTAHVTLIGPDALQALAEAVRGAGVSHETLKDAEVERWLEGPGARYALATIGAGLLVLARSRALGPLPALDLIGDVAPIRAIWEATAAEAGVERAGSSVFETIRVEAGIPAFGVDMDGTTLPPEAGIENDAIDHLKGCYTGQEVIVRIRDRGHVNRRLRGLVFGERTTPPAGSELFRSGADKPIGTVTSAVSSPRFGGVIGLGYVRREIEPPADLRLGGPAGDPVLVRALTPGAWWPEGD